MGRLVAFGYRSGTARRVSYTAASVPSEQLAYAVRRSTRARRVRVVVDPLRGVEVVLPSSAPERAAAEAVREMAPWIQRRLAHADAIRDELERRDGIPYLGQTLTPVAQVGRRRVHRRGDRLLVPEGEDTAREALERWFRRVARQEVVPRLDRAVSALGCTYRDVTIRGQRTRWGSCSATGRLSFNWRLLLAPPEILDYVIWHEACHLRVMDHSRRFWGLLERHRPSYAEERRWLRDHGAMLVL
jgi:predicted metal-dependent hydrolase